MKLTTNAAFFILLCCSGSSFAADQVSNKGQAYAACKAAAYEQFTGVQGVKMLSIRHSKKKYRVKIRVNNGEERNKMTCRVARDGSVEFGEK